MFVCACVCDVCGDVCKYACTCMRVRVCVCVYAYACMRVRVRGRECVCVFVGVNASAGTRICVYACMRACVHACMRACVYACVPDSNSRTNGGQIAAEPGRLELLKTMALSGSPEEKTRATSVCYHISRSPQVCAEVGRGQGAGSVEVRVCAKGVVRDLSCALMMMLVLGTAERARSLLRISLSLSVLLCICVSACENAHQ